MPLIRHSRNSLAPLCLRIMARPSHRQPCSSSSLSGFAFLDSDIDLCVLQTTHTQENSPAAWADSPHYSAPIQSLDKFLQCPALSSGLALPTRATVLLLPRPAGPSGPARRRRTDGLPDLLLLPRSAGPCRPARRRRTDGPGRTTRPAAAASPGRPLRPGRAADGQTTRPPAAASPGRPLLRGPDMQGHPAPAAFWP